MLAYIEFPTWLRTEIIPGLPLRWYGLMYLVAFAVSYVLFVYQVRERKLEIESDTIVNFFFWAIIGLLIGARLFATLLFDPTGRYLRQPWLIFWPFNSQGQFVGLQGMNYYGGLVGAIAGALIYGRVKKIDVLDWGDMLVAGIPLGYTFGRIGNFINGELYGRVTTAAWGVLFPHAQRFPASEPWVREAADQAGLAIPPDTTIVNLPRHPTQLYEAFAEGILMWLIMWFILRKRRPYRGYLIGMYVILYGVFRFVIDYFRMPLRGDFSLTLSPPPNPPYLLESPFNFIASQFYSLLMVAAGVICLVVFARIAKQRADEQKDEPKRRNMRKLRKRIQRR